MRFTTLVVFAVVFFLALFSVSALQEYNDFGTSTANMSRWYNTTGGNSTDRVYPIVCSGSQCNTTSGFAVGANHSASSHFASYELVNAYGESVNISFQLKSGGSGTISFGNNQSNIGNNIMLACGGNQYSVTNKTSGGAFVAVGLGYDCTTWRNISIIFNMSTQKYKIYMGNNVSGEFNPINDTLNISFIRMQGYSGPPTPNISIDELYIYGFNDTTQVTIYNETTRTLISNQQVDITIFNTALSRTASTSSGLVQVPPVTSSTTQTYILLAAGANTTSLPQRFYYLNVPPSNLFQQEVYLLDGNLATLIQVRVEDETGNLVENATVSLKRYYATINDYKTVQQIRTNNNGIGYLYAELNTPLYQFSVDYDGSTIYLSQPQSLFTNTINLQIPLNTPFFRGFDGFTDIQYTHTYDTTNRRFQYTWTDAKAAASQTCMRVNRATYYSTTQIYENCSTATSGTLYTGLINQNLTGEFTSTVTVTVNNSNYKISMLNKNFDAQNKASTWGSLGIFMTFFLIVVLVTMSLWSPSMVIIMSVVGLIVSVVLGWVAMTFGTLITLVIAFGILMWKVRG